MSMYILPARLGTCTRARGPVLAAGALVLAALALAAPPAAGAPILLAEYVAEPQPPWLPGGPGWRSTLDVTRLPEPAQPGREPAAGVLLQGSLARAFPGGRPAWVGSLDYSFYNGPGPDGVDLRRREFAVGPKFFLGRRSTTFLYYRYRRDHLADPVIAPGLLGYEPLFDGEQFGAGLSQTWHFGDAGGRLRLGVEVGGERRADGDVRAESQRLNLSGRIPLFWGLKADIEAGYSLHSYDHGGLGGDAARREFRAGLSRALGERLEATFHYRYADEEAGQDEAAYRREGWNLNLRYNY